MVPLSWFAWDKVVVVSFFHLLGPVLGPDRPLAALLGLAIAGVAMTAGPQVALVGPGERDRPSGPRSPFLESDQASAHGPELHWYKGNTHTHSLNADGDSTPDELVRWYREHGGYQFIVLTDHNFLTSVDALNSVHGAGGKFLVIAGEEVTDLFGKMPVHMNGLGLGRLVPPKGGSSVADVIQRDADAIREAGGVPAINHPNYRWAITADDVRQVRGVNLIEIYSGNPDVNDLGGGGLPGVEAIWDQLLSSGKELYGIAVDDAHSFKDPWNPSAKQPGTGWVVVRSSALEPSAILSALERGEFYASNGIELERIAVTSSRLTVTVKPGSWNKGRVQFIGRGGRMLKEVVTSPADYDFVGDEGYVRARVIASNGRMAWVQPVFLSRAPASR
jgi:hypothetical protein